VTLPAYFECGTGPTAVLLLHGVGGGRAIWADGASHTAAAIADAGCYALAMDFPGYGDSPGTPTLPAMVQAVLDLVAHARIVRQVKHLVLLGHSMGGMVAQEVLHRSPQVAQGLILACTSAAFGKPDGAWQAQFLAERLAPLDAGLGMPGMAEQLVAGLVGPDASAHARDAARRVMACVPEASYRTALHAIAGFDRRGALAALCLPTLMLAAEHDRTAPPEVMQRMAAKVTGAEYLCLPGAGHIANVEAPEAFNGAVVSFLQRHFA
jgi:pimeloyl-ACP methyl ester carboxylesterase